MAQNAVKKTNFTPPACARTRICALPVNSFEESGDAVAPSECDGKYHDNYTPVVALSTAWFRKKRCHTISTLMDMEVWKALGINDKDKEWEWEWLDMTWSDA
ncbi:PREDICTED: putative ripening-related protein 6 [Populus euphratica]|uniref:Ripening-related protein 6 n=1 Tax=Populus euphratica TaxID=75702 RepID=A0AAJ6XS88_POPEU|nr:PREDICTED: putative ripening-related protein 6 [Populus euphratica]